MGLKQNILYSGFLTTSLYVFQFITYPYVARVLGVTNIGICNFVQSIVQYFCLFSMLGISTLGVREIAKCNRNKDELNKTFSRLFTLNMVGTIAVLLVYLISIETVPQLAPYRKLLYIGASQILFGAFAVEWLFRGLEDFKYITIRTMAVRIAYVASIFLFVRKSDDYYIYFAIYSGMIIANGIINWKYRQRFVTFTIQPLAAVKQYIKPMFLLGSQVLLTSVYTTFNVIYLGMACGDVQVGYYTTATKIEKIILSLYSSFTLVMMPRISSKLATNDMNSVNVMLQKSVAILLAFTIPCVAFSEVFAKEIVYLVAGGGYEDAVLPMRIVLPAMLIVGMEQILIVQILMPNKNDKEVFINSIIGASCSVLLNVFFVSHLQSSGSAIVWLASETLVMLSALYFVRTKHPHIDLSGNIFVHIISFMPLCLLLFVLKTFNWGVWTTFLAGSIVALLYSHVCLKYIAKNKAYQLIFDSIAQRWHSVRK